MRDAKILMARYWIEIFFNGGVSHFDWGGGVEGCGIVLKLMVGCGMKTENHTLRTSR